MAEGVYNINKLYQEIKSRGYSGGKSILKSYVRLFRPLAKPSAKDCFPLAPKLLVIDDMGYLPLDNLGAIMLFHLVSMRYERGSIINLTCRLLG